MTFLAKPKVAHPSLPKNALGLTRRQYEGALSTLCAGCGHDSITAAIVEAAWELSLEPQNVVKLSGIGCSSKTTAYFVSGGHGFNSVHGRMPSIATGANAANRRLTYIGVSGDGDTLSIGLGQFCHAIRRHRHEGEEGRDQLPAADRSGPARDDAGRVVRGAQLLRRQAAARAAHRGRPAASRLRADRRAVAVCHLQRSRRLDQE